MRNKIIEVFSKHIKPVYNQGHVINCLVEEDIYSFANDLLLEVDKNTVFKSVATEYAEFLIHCDRKGLPLIKIDDYINNYSH